MQNFFPHRFVFQQSAAPEMCDIGGQAAEQACQEEHDYYLRRLDS